MAPLSSALFSRKKWEANTRRRLFIRELSGGRKGCTMEQTLCIPRQTMSPLHLPILSTTYLFSPSIHPSILPLFRRSIVVEIRVKVDWTNGRASRNWRNIVVQITEATKRLELQIALGGEKAPLGLGPDRVHLPGINIQIRSCWQTNLHTNLVWPRPENRLIVRLRVHLERVVPSRFLVLQIFDLPRFLVFEIFGLWDFRFLRFLIFEIFDLWDFWSLRFLIFKIFGLPRFLAFEIFDL